ncbi:hypothetical protein [Streptomyces aurantiacus]|nr:hypothetical protein [Streptomyces aurantiacus]
MSRQLVVRRLAELAARMVIAAERDGGEPRDDDGTGSLGTA